VQITTALWEKKHESKEEKKGKIPAIRRQAGARGPGPSIVAHCSSASPARFDLLCTARRKEFQPKKKSCVRCGGNQPGREEWTGCSFHTKRHLESIKKKRHRRNLGSASSRKGVFTAGGQLHRDLLLRKRRAHRSRESRLGKKTPEKGDRREKRFCHLRRGIDPVCGGEASAGPH